MAWLTLRPAEGGCCMLQCVDRAVRKTIALSEAEVHFPLKISETLSLQRLV